MRPADVCGCWTNPSSSSLARMLRTVADDTPSPAALTSSDEATGSPDERVAIHSGHLEIGEQQIGEAVVLANLERCFGVRRGVGAIAGEAHGLIDETDD